MWGQPGEVFFIRYVSSVSSETDESNLTCALDMFPFESSELARSDKKTEKCS
jgi:hypothetical protein